MAPVNVPNYSKWHRPPTTVYEDNYGYGINFYQPMIDYISDKEKGRAGKPPHLPWNNERGLDKYKYDKVQTYTDQEVAKLSREVAEQAKRDLNNFEVTKRTPFSVIATAAAANVTKHVGVESITTKAAKKNMNREKIKAERRKKRMDEIEKELELYEKEANVGNELRSKAIMYRGKSAKAIAHTLLEESRKNVAQGKIRKMDFEARKRAVDRNYAYLSENIASQTLHKFSTTCENKMSEAISETIRAVREHSPTTCIVRIKSEAPIIVEETYLQPLQELKETIRQFENISTNIMIDKR
ncbi:paramyosin, short form-like [Amyelois transitella]|uniref:paramyosin, short form-like n=1 Tax=Amyelois transitella TaxID=680683 RepID=UPI00298F9C4C|nr:paramyosin, short form-like [Amyelois transitella]